VRSLAAKKEKPCYLAPKQQKSSLEGDVAKSAADRKNRHSLQKKKSIQ